jgi:hypothetical protein
MGFPDNPLSGHLHCLTQRLIKLQTQLSPQPLAQIYSHEMGKEAVIQGALQYYQPLLRY